MMKAIGRMAVTAALVVALNGCGSGVGKTDANLRVRATALPGAECINNRAGDFPCSRMDLVGGLQFNASASDIWGWHDEQAGVDYALLGLSVGTAFIRLDPISAPEFIAFLPTVTEASHWRDIKVLGHHALIVSEAKHHGLQVVDLRSLAALEEYTILQADAHDHQFGSAHNVAVNEDTAMAYVVGSDRTCSGGLHMIDMAVPLAPRFVGCYDGDEYTHDAQCVTYQGPDIRYLGHELCFAANEESLTIVDVTDKSAPQMVAKSSYAGAEYTHQGWLTEDQRYFLMGDEGDEIKLGHNTRTYIWDLSDLRNPRQTYQFTAATAATDHNLYIIGDHVYQANYQAGVRVLRHGDLARGELVEVGYFDTVPLADTPRMEGAWSVYPYFGNGLSVTANTDGRFFVLRSRVEELSRCDDRLDNDNDGVMDNATECEPPAEMTE